MSMSSSGDDDRNKIDGKPIFTFNGIETVLLYQCPKSNLRINANYCSPDTLTSECPYRVMQGSRNKVGDMIYDVLRGCPFTAEGHEYVCYKIQTLKDYLKRKGEIEHMEKSGIKDARRMPDGVTVATDDIVEVSIGYVSSSIYEKLHSKTFKARIIKFENSYISLDLSEQYKSNIVEVKYDDINRIAPVKEEVTDANID